MTELLSDLHTALVSPVYLLVLACAVVGVLAGRLVVRRRHRRVAHWRLRRASRAVRDER